VSALHSSVDAVVKHLLDVRELFWKLVEEQFWSGAV
jgi:hypothetical protein